MKDASQELQRKLAPAQGERTHQTTIGLLWMYIRDIDRGA